MRRYSLLFALVISILLPLHVAAGTLLSAHTCPAETASEANTAADTMMAAQDCCNEDNGKLDCQTMPSCHGYSVFCQLASFSIPPYSLANQPDHPVFAVSFVASFDPGAIWRPPTNS